MRNKITTMLLGCLLVMVFAVHQVFYVVRTGDQAVVTRFGRPVRAVTEAGLYRKWPWPVEQLHLFDGRLRARENTIEETYTLDQRNIIVQTFIYWRIADPLVFLQRVGDPEAADEILDGLVRSHRSMVIGRHAFGDLVNADAGRRRFEEMEQAMLAPVAEEARQRYGLEVTMLGIRRINLPDSVTAQVYERMRAERRMAADRFRAEGESEAARLRARAEMEREKIMADADVQAMRLRAEGDVAAAEFYEVFEEDPELAVFMRKLDVLEAALREKTTVILGTDTVPFDLLKGTPALPGNNLK